MSPIDLCFHEKSKLWVENLVCQLRHELFKKSTCIVPHLFNTVLVDKVDFEPAACIELGVLSINGKRVLKDEITAHSEDNCLPEHLIGRLVLVKHICEYLGTNFEVIYPRDVLKDDLVHHRLDFVVIDLICLCGHVFVNHPEVWGKKLQSMISIDQGAQCLFQIGH